jgi:hypothetical protein
MATKHKEMQFLIREWKQETGNIEIDMHQVAEFATKRGWPIPAPVSGIDRLAKEFSQAAREETRPDTKTGRPYRVYHAYPNDAVGQGMLWIDIDDAPRKTMVKSVVMRREQVVGDMVQLYLDLEHWNRVNKEEERIDLHTDLTQDVKERIAASDGSDSGQAA